MKIVNNAPKQIIPTNATLIDVSINNIIFSLDITISSKFEKPYN